VTDDRQGEVTALLDQIRGGDAGARDRLIELVYHELRQLAGGVMRQEAAGHSLQPTALMHDALLRLLRPDILANTQDRPHLLATAARAMRRILVDHARQQKADKRGGGERPVPLDDALAYFTRQNLDVQAVHEALEELTSLHERQSQIVELRFFGGYTMEEIAGLLQISLSTAESDFRKASAFLRSRLVGSA
jgi:RNA polymerase sigma factor (TIGR02999 family)